MPSKCEICFERPIIRPWGITNVCGAPECLAQIQECANGDECEAQQYFKAEDDELNHKGLCEACEELSDPEDGEMCEHCVDDVPATTWVGGHSLCDDCAGDA